MAQRNRLDLSHEMIDLGLAPVEFYDHQGRGVERIAGVHEGFGRLDRRPVHDLHAAGNDAGADHACDALSGGPRRTETR